MKKQVNELDLERAKILLGQKEGKGIDENKLKKILERIKVFCKVAYQLYIENVEPDKPAAIMKKFESKPPDEFTKAA